jgi:hypothetical protein
MEANSFSDRTEREHIVSVIIPNYNYKLGLSFIHLNLLLLVMAAVKVVFP